MYFKQRIGKYGEELAEAYLNGTGEYIPIFIPLKKWAQVLMEFH